MSAPRPFSRRWFLLPLLSVLAVVLGGSAAHASAGPSALFSQTNDPSGNAVQRFARAADGRLTSAGTFQTGGVGLADLGGRQGAVETSDDGAYVYAVNAGSDSLTVFRSRRSGLEVVDTADSGGVAPVSVDRQGGRLYVLNSGGVPNVTGFTILRDGSLRPIAGGMRELPGALGAAQVSVAPSGRALVVSERLANRLETLPLDRLGRPGGPRVIPSSGAVPFGFAFSRPSTLVVSEAGASTVSSYRLLGVGILRQVTASLPVAQGAACWVAASPGGRFAYTGNAAGGISGFAVGATGALALIGVTPLAPSPRDLDFTPNGRFLYAVSPGTADAGGQVTGYRVGDDGSLTRVTSAPAAAGITGAAVH
jgi:6-phosphogluconolactonase (cycloisomerase 2 family)